MKKLMATVLTLGILTWAGSVMAVTLSNANWTWNDGSGNTHEYYVFTGKLTWETAYNNLSEGQYLATITSQDEQDALVTAMANFQGEYWLGGLQLDPSSVAAEGWSWADTGEAFCYTSWQSGEPNDWGGSEMHLGTWANFGWNWNDEHGSANIVGYIVETGAAYGPSCAPVPEPATLLLLGSGLAGLAFYRRKRK